MNYRRALIRLFTFLGGIYFFLYYVLPETIGGSPDPNDPTRIIGGLTFGKYHEEISDGFVLIGAMAVGLGLINLVMVHGSKLIYRRSRWINSLALLVGLVVMALITGRDWFTHDSISREVNEIYVLSKFSLQIRADSEQNAALVPAYWIRNQALSDATLTLVDKLSNSIEKMLASPPKGTDLAIEERFRQSSREARADLTEIRSIVGRLVTIKANEAADLSADTALGQALNMFQTTWRELRGAHYDSSNAKHAYDLLYNGLFMSLGAAMFSLLGFYIASAAYRAFRIKSPESGLMMLAALLVMLGQIPFGIWAWREFPEVRLWLLQVPNTAASRAIEMGAAVAGLIMAARMWLSIDSESFK